MRLTAGLRGVRFVVAVTGAAIRGGGFVFSFADGGDFRAAIFCLAREDARFGAGTRAAYTIGSGRVPP